MQRSESPSILTNISGSRRRRPWIRGSHQKRDRVISERSARECSDVECADETLSAPLITLYVSPMAKHEGEQAFDILREARQGFKVKLLDEPTVAVEFAGKVHQGLDGVQRLSQGLRSFGETLFGPGTEMIAELDRLRDTKTGEQARQELEAQFAEARSTLARLLG